MVSRIGNRSESVDSRSDNGCNMGILFFKELFQPGSGWPVIGITALGTAHQTAKSIMLLPGDRIQITSCFTWQNSPRENLWEVVPKVLGKIIPVCQTTIKQCRSVQGSGL